MPSDTNFSLQFKILVRASNCYTGYIVTSCSKFSRHICNCDNVGVFVYLGNASSRASEIISHKFLNGYETDKNKY